jgi:cell division protein ZapA (FtsZ GTPase activity inhibitor)
MKTPNSIPSASLPSSPIKVNIFNSQYFVKPTENLTEDEIRELAAYVDRRLHEVSRKSAHDKSDVAIMVALNIAAQMCEKQKRFTNSIRQLIQRIDEAVDGDTAHDTPRTVPTFDPT